jgi:hypothetical protein
MHKIATRFFSPIARKNMHGQSGIHVDGAIVGAGQAVVHPHVIFCDANSKILALNF